MIWLDICDNQGNSIYFDIHYVERRRIGRRWRHAVNGVCGNGLFEVEVLVESGDCSEVTFVDLSVGAVAGPQLLRGVDLSRLETGLINAATERCGAMPAPVVKLYPHPDRPVSPYVNESGPVWQAAG